MIKKHTIKNLINNLKTVINESDIVKLKKDTEMYEIVLKSIKSKDIEVYESQDNCLIVKKSFRITRSFIL